jgi:hypothetical protein
VKVVTGETYREPEEIKKERKIGKDKRMKGR